MLMPNITMNACGNYDGAKLVFKNLSEQTEKATLCNYNLYWKIQGICRISPAHTIKKWSEAITLPRATAYSSET